jgi:hypothetical protein
VFPTVTKIGTGLSDAQWREVRERCEPYVSERKPARIESNIEPSVWVEPQVVIEVLADEITRSPVHPTGADEGGQGYALRFPRLVSFRQDDKKPEDVTTVAEIVSVAVPCYPLRSSPRRRIFPHEYPFLTSTSSGTESSAAFFISCTTTSAVSASSMSGTSSSSSSWTCSSVRDAMPSSRSRECTLIIASLMISATMPWLGMFSTLRGPRARV